jgi:hypothetical protein
MEAAAARLPPAPPSDPDAPEAAFLTGRKFWFQTAFCAWSLRHSAGPRVGFAFYDDGSFDGELTAEARRLFPGCRIVPAAEEEANLDVHLPSTRYPALRGQRLTYLHLRKLTDFHAGRTGWHLGLDSDMLFFRRPDELMGWLAAPDRPVHMIDVHDAYGYPEAALSALAGRAVPSRVNVGICGLQSDLLDWDRIESWCARLLAEHGTSYYLEQALIALVLAGQPALRLPADQYRLMPEDSECSRPTAVMHHYVDLSKRGYFRHAWRKVASAAGAAEGRPVR